MQQRAQLAAILNTEQALLDLTTLIRQDLGYLGDETQFDELDSIDSGVDAVRVASVITNNKLDLLNSNLTAVGNLITITNAKLDTLNTSVLGVQARLDTSNGYLNTTATQATNIAGDTAQFSFDGSNLKVELQPNSGAITDPIYTLGI